MASVKSILEIVNIRLVKGGEDVIPVGNSVLSLDNIFVRRKYRPLP